MNLLHANDLPGRYPESWYAETAKGMPQEPLPALKGAQRADVCVVGGGYTGLSAALHLAGRGHDVVLLEAHRVGWGASGRNGGQVGSGQRRSQSELEAMLGAQAAHGLWEIAEEAKALVRDLVSRHRIDCDLKPGVAYVHWKASGARKMQAEAEHLARAYGYREIEPLDRAGVRRLLGTEVYHGGILDRGAAHLHPLNYALGLARAAREAGVRVFERSEVSRLDGTTAITRHGKVEARHLIVACNGYIGGLLPEAARRVMPINNFIIATEPLGQARAEALIAEDVAVADSRFVVNYWRRTPDHRILWGGGESYGWRFPRDIAGLVRREMLRVYPQLEGVGITHAWGGTLAITLSRLPCFLRPAPGVFFAGGYSGHGVALATIAGRICAEAVEGQGARFDLMASVPTPPFPGGALLRRPTLVAAMTWYGLRDRLGL